METKVNCQQSGMPVSVLQASSTPALPSGFPTHCVVAAQRLVCESYSLENGELLAFTRQPSVLFPSVCSHPSSLPGGTERGAGFIRTPPPFMRKLVGIATYN